MTWAELEEVARNAIASELGGIPAPRAAAVAKRIIEDVKIGLAKEGWQSWEMTSSDEPFRQEQDPPSF